MIRVRHFTSVSRRNTILAENRLLARDQNKVFFERARGRPESPRDVEDRYDLDRGCGNAYVEFNVDPPELMSQYNNRLQMVELYLVGDVDLVNRSPTGHDNL